MEAKTETKNNAGEIKGRGRKWIKWVLILALLAAIILLVVSRMGAGKAGQAVTGERLQPVEVAAVMMKTLGEELSVSGTVTAFAEAKVAPRVMGRVSAVYAEVGQRVSQGEILLVVDQTDYMTALKQAEANLSLAEANSIQAGTAYENAKLNHQRNEELYKLGALPVSQLEASKGQLAAAESGYKANQAQIRQCQAVLEKAQSDHSGTEVRAPFPGVVARRMADVGEMVSQQGPVFVIIRDDPLLVKVNLPESAVTKVSLDQQVDIYVAATGKTYKGTVKSVAPQADETSKAFPTEIRLVGIGPEVRPGMVADLKIRTREVDNALVVPTDSLLDRDGGYGVFVVENGVAHHRKVTTGLSGQGYTQVPTGLKQGEVVVVRGNHLLVDGMKVRVEAQRRDNPTQAGGEAR